MRIGVYDPYLNDVGGGEKYMMTLASCLTDIHEVDVFWDNQDDLMKIHERFGIDISGITRVENIFRLDISFMKRFAMSKKYDAIIFLSDGSIPFLGSKRIFLHIQQPLEYMHTHSLWDKFKLMRVTKFFANSVYTKSYIERKFHIDPLVIYPPIALFPRNVKKENYILHVGRFRLVDPLTHAGDFKKQYIMIDAFKEMVKKGLKKWKFVLAVSIMEKEKEAFEKMRDSAKGFPIEFLVNESNDKLWDMYSKAKIYWHASGFGENLETHPEYAEHFGISTVEAMGAGCVPVVINAGGQKEIVTDGSDGFLWNTLEELQEKTKELTQDATLLKKLSEKAKKRANDFSFERFSLAVHKLVV